MPAKPLDGLIIRAAIVRMPGAGYIYAADPQKDARDIPHTVILKYKDGEFIHTEANYNAHSPAIVSQPGLGLIEVSGSPGSE